MRLFPGVVGEKPNSGNHKFLDFDVTKFQGGGR